MNTRSFPAMRVAPVSRGVAASVRAALFLVLLATGAPGTAAAAQSLRDADLRRIDFQQHLNQQVTLDREFCDETGRRVALRTYCNRQPVILVLSYYRCPMLCTLIGNGLIEALVNLRASAGRDFQVVFVSIDPTETPAQARDKKQEYILRYARPGTDAGWHCLTGDNASIRALADEVGFYYAYDPAAKQYAHPSGLVLLTPQGKVSRYFFGIQYPPSELQEALTGAAAARVSSPVHQFLLLCFHYSPLRGRYGTLIMTVLRVAAAGLVVALAVTVVRLARQDRQQRSSFAPARSEPVPGRIDG